MLPARLQQAGTACIHLASFCIYTDNLRTASTVAARATKRDTYFGYCLIAGKRVYWCKLGLKNDPCIYAS